MKHGLRSPQPRQQSQAWALSSSLSPVPELQLIFFKHLKDKRSPVEPQDEKWDLGVLSITPKTKTPLVTTSVPRHQVCTLLLFNIHQDTLTHAQNKTKKHRRHQWQSRAVFQTAELWLFIQTGCKHSSLLGQTDVRTHTHPLPHCVACNLVILGLWPVKVNFETRLLCVLRSGIHLSDV